MGKAYGLVRMITVDSRRDRRNFYCMRYSNILAIHMTPIRQKRYAFIYCGSIAIFLLN